MQPGDQSTSDDPAYDTPVLQTTLFPLPESHPLPIREFLATDQPRNRLAHQGASALSDAELLAVITGVPCLETAQRLLIAAGGLRGLQALSTIELQQLVAGISVGRAAQLKASIELGTRVARGERVARRQVKSPTDIADLLLLVDREHFVGAAFQTDGDGAVRIRRDHGGIGASRNTMQGDPGGNRAGQRALHGIAAGSQVFMTGTHENLHRPPPPTVENNSLKSELLIDVSLGWIGNLGTLAVRPNDDVGAPGHPSRGTCSRG